MAAMHHWQSPATSAVPQGFSVNAVVVPLDGSDSSRFALSVARVLAELEGASIHLTYVGAQLCGAREMIEELGLTPDDLRGVVLDQVAGAPADAILQVARGLPQSLVVMSAYTGAPKDERALGEVAKAVLRAAPARVVLVMPEYGREPWRIRRVLLAHEGTPRADFAIAPTADLAHRAGAEVIALHVAARGSSGPVEPGSLPAPRYIDQPQHEWPAWAGEFVERMLALGGSAAAINFKLLVTGGQPGSEIAQFARENQTDLVVLPWDGQWKEEQVGATDVIVRRAGCPVLLICTGEATSR